MTKFQERDDHIRESWVRAMEARLVRDELDKCQKGEGVNHYENCKWLSEKYIKMLSENRVRRAAGLTLFRPRVDLGIFVTQVQGYKHIDI
ncbi:hypothetical protein DXG03_000220 [Asterophora parasitica]|uniref:NADH-ubiquinone oxidoreductase 12 kDa subunit n=1 Tax=Asterophora parasitica TaxID=117018 RepID=A0A9P7KIM6_9AGAR|nr:hypothetical protein DXG03_000220 [Asterophora parasitica]